MDNPSFRRKPEPRFQTIFEGKLKAWAPDFAGATIGDVLSAASSVFNEAGFEAAAVEARALMAGILRCSRSALLLHRDDLVDTETVDLFEQWIERRLKREPVAYITGVQGFMGEEFEITPDVLVPRPETELLVEDALMEARDRGLTAPRVLDIGTGSGCIAISIAMALPEAHVLAVDVDEAAIAVADKNALRLNANVSFLRSDLFTELPRIREGAFDMILANPPYINTAELSGLEPEISYEPRHALDGGQDGLAFVGPIILGARVFLKPGGLLMMEIGHDQGARARDLFERNGFENVSILKDYSGFDRIAKGTKRGSV